VTPEKIIKVTEIVDLRIEKDTSSVVVVSARGDPTDDLVRMGRSVSGKRNDREMDMLLSWVEGGLCCSSGNGS
jgi:aspartokinase